MSDVAIRIENLGKKYRIGTKQARYQTLRESLTGSFTNIFKKGNGSHKEDNTIWALKDIDLEVKHGEVLGIIGRNGAGKSTLLKILARITKPTTGRVELNGRVGSLLEVGTGFHPELTGRENIFLSGAILGMHRQEINRKFDEIVAFSEIEKFLDTQVKHYSSGMYMRLAFAVAAHLEPEILLVDEVLAVGDAEFQKKCLGKMGDVAGEGRTVLFVSHNMINIETLAIKSLLIECGRISVEGFTPHVISTYLSRVISSSQNLSTRLDRFGNELIKINDYQLINIDGKPIQKIQCGKYSKIRLIFEKKNNISICKNVRIDITFNFKGVPLILFSNQYSESLFTISHNKGYMDCIIPIFPLTPGDYEVNFHCIVNGTVSDHIDAAFIASVIDGDFYKSQHLIQEIPGRALATHKWEFCQIQE